MNRAVDIHSGGALLDGLITFPPRRVVGFGGFGLCHDLFLYDLTTGVNQNHGSGQNTVVAGSVTRDSS